MDKDLNLEVVVPYHGDASPSAFQNVYETGDRWEKIIGCDGCTFNCCTNCSARMPESNRCAVHLEEPDAKRWKCVKWPRPNQAHPGCQQEFKCVKGSPAIVGKVRRVTDAKTRFFEGEDDG